MLALLLNGGQIAQGGLTAQLDSVTITAEAHVRIRAYVAVTLDDVALIAKGTTLAGVESNERSYRVPVERRAYKVAPERRVYSVQR